MIWSSFAARLKGNAAPEFPVNSPVMLMRQEKSHGMREHTIHCSNVPSHHPLLLLHCLEVSDSRKDELIIIIPVKGEILCFFELNRNLLLII
jgi:hypothetical protein